jgi:Uma2 family endonuclease
MATPQRKLVFTEAEYLAFERKAEGRHEYIDGQIRALASESMGHARICMNLARELGIQLKGRHCEPFSKDMKVRSGPAQTTKAKWPPKGFFSYPDTVIVCGPVCHDEFQDVVINPKVILEVLSESTETFDRGEKFKRYRKHKDTLTDYILIAQDKPYIEHFTRQPENNWLLQQVEGLEASLLIASIDCHLSLAELYDRVPFPNNEEAKEEANEESNDRPNDETEENQC